jgi:hypothetical protein
LNLGQFTPSFRNQDVDPNACLESLESLLDRVPGVGP